MTLREWAEAAERFHAMFGPVGALAVGFAGVSIVALIYVWRALRWIEKEQTQQIMGVVGANTKSHESTALAQRDSTAAIARLSEAMDRFAQTMRDAEEQRRHSIDLLIQSLVREAHALPEPRRAGRRRKSAARA